MLKQKVRKKMKTFRVLEVVTKVYAFDVKAEDELDALGKIECSLGGETQDIVRCSENDDTTDRYYQCEGEVGK